MVSYTVRTPLRPPTRSSQRQDVLAAGVVLDDLGEGHLAEAGLAVRGGRQRHAEIGERLGDRCLALLVACGLLEGFPSFLVVGRP
jgi:hypothetical protein